MKPIAYITDDSKMLIFADKVQHPTNMRKLFDAPPRDVLMEFGEAVKIACVKAWGAADECDEGNAIRDCDIAALADRYASKVQPEPVNQQLLVALNNVLDLFGGVSWRDLDLDGKPALDVVNEAHAAIAAAEEALPVGLAVWYGSMPETNGKSNWTAILHRKDGCMSEGITIARSEYPDRVRYEADRVRYLIGELEAEPNILDYDGELHSGYVAKQPASAQPVVVPEGWRDELELIRAVLEGYPQSIARNDALRATRAMLSASR